MRDAKTWCEFRLRERQLAARNWRHGRLHDTFAWNGLYLCERQLAPAERWHVWDLQNRQARGQLGLRQRQLASAMLASEDWSKMEYSYYLLRGNGLDEQVVMQAINRAKRRFFLRPAYVARHAGDVLRLALTKQSIMWQVLTRTIFGTRVVDAQGVRAQPASQDQTA